MCRTIISGSSLNQSREMLKLKIKKLYDERKVPFLFAFGIVGGLFALSLILGIAFMDYDPMTMIEGIKEDLKVLFG